MFSLCFDELNEEIAKAFDPLENFSFKFLKKPYMN